MSEDWICERQYQSTIDGRSTAFMVRWARPVPNPEGDWRCIYQIEWPSGVWARRETVGIDSVQALHLAMQAASAALYDAETPVFWFEPDDVLGLPVMVDVAEVEAARTKGRP